METTVDPKPEVGHHRLVRLEHDYDFECEAGPLKLCQEFIELKDSLPDYLLGDWVTFDLKGEVDGVEVSVETTACVAATRLASDTERRYIEYGLTTDPASAYHYGEPVKWWRRARDLK